MLATCRCADVNLAQPDDRPIIERKAGSACTAEVGRIRTSGAAGTPASGGALAFLPPQSGLLRRRGTQGYPVAYASGIGSTVRCQPVCAGCEDDDGEDEYGQCNTASTIGDPHLGFPPRAHRDRPAIPSKLLCDATLIN